MVIVALSSVRELGVPESEEKPRIMRTKRESGLLATDRSAALTKMKTKKLLGYEGAQSNDAVASGRDLCKPKTVSKSGRPAQPRPTQPSTAQLGESRRSVLRAQNGNRLGYT